ncbi:MULTISPECIES: type II toxin-antitoxin system Phd/YefM family antitoxin [Lacticaseibacillus]|uniref:type II toxin-antitoxin system Phd/YefM family antitoxin n=1 Tax=Lacticaseibacillus TaxID=2759736 RepID=UPI00063DA7EA|nr:MULTISPECIES: type II toxin-antitoxin system Phd/YefM family antitoxin [Lacticaseibacillus]KLI75661.1 prevent-host-death protein [Lacticaseibacillus casei]
MEVYTPTNLRKNLFDLLNKIVDKNEEMEVTLKQPKGPNKGVVLISKDRYEKLEELDFLQRTGTLDVVMQRMENEKPGDFNEKDAY